MMYVFLWLLCLPSIALGQIQNESVFRLKENITPHERLNIYTQLAKDYWWIQQDSAMHYTNKAHALALELKDEKALSHIALQQAIVHNSLQNDSMAHHYLTMALNYADKYGLDSIKAESYLILGQVLKVDPDTAMKYYDISLSQAEAIAHQKIINRIQIRKSRLLLHQKRHEELAEVFDQLIQDLHPQYDKDELIEVYTYMALTFRDLKQKAKALLYASKALELADSSNNIRLKSFVLGAIGSGIISYFNTFDEAIILVDKAISYAKVLNDPVILRSNKKRLALLHLNNNDNKKCGQILEELLVDNKDPDVFRYKGILLSDKKEYEKANLYYDSAYALYAKDKAYVQLKSLLQQKLDNMLAVVNHDGLSQIIASIDSLSMVINDAESQQQFFELETKYRTAEKESELQKKQLELVTTQNRIILIVIITLAIIIGSVFFILYLKNKQKSKDLHFNNQLLKLQSDFNSVELARINNQLNPHEIKNLLTSIAPDIITKAPEAYKKMIRLFNVTRASLNNQLTEDLSIQIQQVEDYLTLQNSISPFPFEFEIIRNIENEEECKLPRLLLKNVVENALKHGIQNRQDGGRILVQCDEVNDYYHIIVKDNGIPSLHSKSGESTGVGWLTYQKLIQLTNRRQASQAELSLERIDDWTVVKIILPSNYTFE